MTYQSNLPTCRQPIVLAKRHTVLSDCRGHKQSPGGPLVEGVSESNGIHRLWVVFFLRACALIRASII